MGKDRAALSMDFGMRVAAVVEREGALLLVRHQKPDSDPYWVLPGGRLEPGERIPECAGRELAEETGLTAGFLGILYVSEFLRDGRHTIDIVARMALEGDGKPPSGATPRSSLVPSRPSERCGWASRSCRRSSFYRLP